MDRNMKTVIALFLVIFSITTGVISQYVPVCNPDDYVRVDGDPYIPELPDQFFYSLEASLVELNQSWFISEYYDGIGNRGRFDVTQQGMPKVTAISNYNLGQSFVFPNLLTGDECTVSTLTTNATQESDIVRFLFGIILGENNTVHIGAPSFIFTNWINSSNVKYLGVTTTSRGIPAYRWQACVSISDISFTLDYYFTNSNLWMNSHATKGYIPVTVALKGSQLVEINGGDIIFDTEHYYTFVDYRSGENAVSDDDFAVPLGVICSNRNPGKPLPPLPNFFSSVIQQVDSLSNRQPVVTFQEYYDTKYNLFRIDGYSTAVGTFSVVQDYNVGVKHVIEPVYARCTSLPLTAANPTAVTGINGDLHLKSVQDIFFTQNTHQFVYEGTSNVNGIDADVWIAQNFTSFKLVDLTFHNIHYQLFFSRPGHAINTITGVTSDPVVLQAIVFGDMTTNDADGIESEPPLDVFDVRSCYSQNQYVGVLMRLQLNQTYFNRNNIRQSIRQAITDYAKSINMPLLSPLQISAIEICSFDDQYTNIEVHISNVSANATKKWSYTARALVDKMLEGVSNGDRLPFTIAVDDKEYTPYYMSDSADNGPSDEPIEPTTKPASEATDNPCITSRVSDGAVAGISISTFVFGLFIGAVAILIAVACFFLLYHGSSKGPRSSYVGSERLGATKYHRQIDELPPVYGDTD